MIITFLIRLLQMLALVAMQVLVFNHIHLLGYATPLVYVAFLFYFPWHTSRVGILLWSFVLGMIVDFFTNTPGVTAGSMVFAAMVQPVLLNAMVPKDSIEEMVPTYKSMGRWNHVRHVMLVVFLQQAVFFLLESFSFFNPIELLLTFGGSYILTLILILALESFRGRNS